MEDCRKPIEEERTVPEIHFGQNVHGRGDGREKHSHFLVSRERATDHREQFNGLFEEQRDRRESHSVGAGIIRRTRSQIEETWEVKVDVTHSVWPWIAE